MEKGNFHETNDMFDLKTINYHDREMKKWDGFIISEHRERIEKEDKKRSIVYEAKEQQDEETVSKMLFRLMQNNRQASLQLNELENGLYKAPVVGFVSGFDEGTVYIKTNEKTISVEIGTIRNAGEVEFLKWFSQDM